MNNSLTRLRFVTAAFVCTFLLILLLADRGTLPAFIARLYAFPHGDKAGHFLLMGLLSFLVNLNLAWQKTNISWRKSLLTSLAISILIVLEESSQVFIPRRSFSLSDLLFSLLGIWLFGCLATLLAVKIWGSGHFSKQA